MCKLPKFDIGGSVHIITNNQVGFTTNSSDARSFEHSSDIVKSFGIPVIRINANDAITTPESLIRVCKFIISYWKTYKQDILIDMIGFRKHGHNEVDEPGFTQPHMYEAIRSMKSLGHDYGKRLMNEGVITQNEIDGLIKQINEHFEAEFEKSKNFVPTLKQTMNERYKGSRAYTHKWEGIVPS